MEYSESVLWRIESKYFNKLCKWYKEKILKFECDYIVFCSKRMYSLALLLEQITGDVMDNRYLTNSAIVSICEELANVYKTTGKFPKILLVEDISNLCFSINTVINNIENRLETLLADELDDLKLKLSESISIEIFWYAPTNKNFIKTKYARHDAHFCVAYEEYSKWRNFSYDLSIMLTSCGMQCPEYMPSMIISEDDLKKLPENEYSPVSFYNVDGYTKVELVTNNSTTVYAILSLRFTKISNSEYYRVIPFVLMPNLDFDETMTLYKEIQKHISKENTSFINYLDSLCKVDGMRAFNEWISFILGQTLINEFCKKYNISQTSESKKDFEWNIKRLLRNYVNKDFVTYVTQNSILSNVTDLKDCILKSAYNRPISSIGSKVCDFQEEVTRMEDLVYNLYCDNQNFRTSQSIHQIGYFKHENVCTALNTIIYQQTQQFTKDLITAFLAIQDSWMMEITSCSTSNIRVVGYSQFVKVTLDTGLLMPLRHINFIAPLSEAYNLCKIFDLNLKNYLYNWFSFCKFSQKEKDDILLFLKQLDTINQTVSEWNIHYVLSKEQLEIKEKILKDYASFYMYHV